MKKLFVIMFSLVSLGAKAEKIEFPRYTPDAKNAVNRCRSLDTDTLSEIRHQMIAAGVIGGIAGSGNVASAVLTGIKPTRDSKGVNLATNIATGVSTVGSMVNVTLSATSISKIQDLIDDLDACLDGLDNIPEISKIYSDKDKSYLAATAKEDGSSEQSSDESVAQ